MLKMQQSKWTPASSVPPGHPGEVKTVGITTAGHLGLYLDDAAYLSGK